MNRIRLTHKIMTPNPCRSTIELLVDTIAIVLLISWIYSPTAKCPT